MKRRLGLIPILVLVLAFIAVSAVSAEEFEYIGSKGCKKCHLKQFKSWEATTMSQSFEKLRAGAAAEAKTAAGLDPDKDYTTDAECVGCHVTGYGKAGGFVDEATTPDLIGVGCEECHGPGGTYTQDEYMSLKNKEYVKAEVVAVGMVDTVGEAQCVSCHNEKSPFWKGEFVFNKDDGIHEHHPLKYEH